VGSSRALGPTYRLELEAGKKLIFGRGEVGEDILRRGLGVYIGGSVKGDVPEAGEKKGVRNLDVHGGGLTLQSMSAVDHGYWKDPSKAQFTMSADLARLEYVYRRQETAGLLIHGMKGTIASIAAHGAFKLGGIPVDLCGQFGAGRYVGEAKVSDQKFDEANFIDLHACAGVGLGKVGHLGYTYKLALTQQNDKGYLAEQSHEVSLRKIGGTPLAVSARHEQGNGDVFDGKAGSERSYSAQFLSVGGEF
jgi:hypothetical protein